MLLSNLNVNVHKTGDLVCTHYNLGIISIHILLNMMRLQVIRLLLKDVLLHLTSPAVIEQKGNIFAHS